MLRSTVSLILVMLLVAAPNTVFAYSSSQSASGSDNGAARTFNFTSLPSSNGTVTIAVFVRGDFNSSAEYVTVSADGTNLGNATGTARYNGNANCLQGTTNFTVPASTVADGSLSVVVDATSSVNYGPCEPWTYTVTVSYDDNNAPTISNVANVSTPEDTATSVAFTVADSEDSNGSLAVTAASSNPGVVAPGGLTLGGSGSNRTLGIAPVADASGTSTITLTVTDSGGLTDTDTFVVTVTPTNDAPIANAGSTYTGNEGSAIALDGSGSSDIDDAIVSWDWDCDNDGTFESASASATGGACTFDDDGVYTVGLQVQDASGAVSTNASTAVVSVGNVAPTLAVTGPTSGDEGTAVAWTLVGGDASPVDAAALSYAWTVTDPDGGTTTGTGAGIAYTPANSGAYTIDGTVTDPQGASANASGSFAAGNVAPSLAITGPSSVAEGAASAWALVGTDPSPLDEAGLSYSWSVLDGGGAVASGVGSAVSWTPADDGAYSIQGVATDLDGASVTTTLPVTVTNVAPSASASGPTSGDEGTQLSFSATGSDAGSVDAGLLTLGWVVSDGGGAQVATGAGSSLDWTPADDGAYTVTVTATDPQGATGTDAISVSVANVAPTVVASGPLTGDEGFLLSFAATPADVGATDAPALTSAWDVTDGTGASVGTGSGTTFDWTPADDGTYTVTVTTTDPQAATGSDALVVVVANVAPVIDSTPPPLAPEGVLYTYAPTVTDPGAEVFTWSLSASAPAGMTIDAASGLIEWTPTYADALAGTASAVLTVDDGDGATASQTMLLTVDVADTDGDGMADSWESANGLDPNDPNDGGADPDADGLSNLEEYQGGTDPSSYDGPGLAVLTDPVAGVEVDTSAPDLFWTNAPDPQGDALTYSVEVYADQAMTTLLTSVASVSENGALSSTWKVDLALPENGVAWWRVQAADPFVAGGWTDLESFFVNEFNAAPTTPTLTAPIGGEVAASLSPTLTWSEATDEDLDPLTYEVVVFDEDGLEVGSASEIVGDGLAATWTIDGELAEDRVYSWTARALDDAGGVGDWAAEETFFVSTSNAAPTDVVFLEPLDGAFLTELSPVLVATSSEDPEGGAVSYWFEIDVVPSFDSANLLEATVEDPMWDLADDGITLPENTEVYARVRALDEADIASLPDTIAFFVGGDNEPPSVPELLAPADGSEGGASPTFEVADPIDPEGDVVFVEFMVARDEAMTELIASGEVVVSGDGSTTWQAGVNLEGTVYWTARARDQQGATSEAAEAWSFLAPTESVAPGDDDDDDDDGTGCDCASSLAPSPASLAWLLLVPLVALRRRTGGR